MFKKKLLATLLAVIALVLIPSFAIAQTTDTEYDSFNGTTYDYNYGEDTSLSTTSRNIIITNFFYSIALYVYISVTYMIIAKKLNHPRPWFAWFPILRSILYFQLGQMSGWNVLLMVIPLLNIYLLFKALMRICERRGEDKSLAYLALIPLAGLVLFGILAWKKDEKQQEPQQQGVQYTQQPVQQAPPQQPVQQTPQQQQSTNEETYLKPQQPPNTPTGA